LLARSLAIRSAFNEPANSPAVINLVSAARSRPTGAATRALNLKKPGPTAIYQRRVLGLRRRDLDAHCLSSASIHRRRCFARKRREAKKKGAMRAVRFSTSRAARDKSGYLCNGEPPHHPYAVCPLAVMCHLTSETGSFSTRSSAGSFIAVHTFFSNDGKLF